MWDLSQTSVTCRTVCGHLNEGHVTKGAFIWQPNTVRKPNRFTWYTNGSKRWHPEILWPQKRQNQEHQHKQGNPPPPTHPPQLVLWGSGSGSCPSGLNRAHTVLKKKTCSAHCSRLSLSPSVSAGFCQTGQTKDTGNTQDWHGPPQWAW